MHRPSGSPSLPGLDRRRAVGLLVMLALVVGLLAACKPTPPPTLTPMGLQLVGQWEFIEGETAKGEKLTGQKISFAADGTFVWEKREGRFLIHRDSFLRLQTNVGEILDYSFTLSGDTLEINRGTPCGKMDQFKLARIKP